MGHERVGTLPKTKSWKAVVNELSSFSSSNNNIADIAQQTLKNVRKQYENIQNDAGVQSAFKFIIALAHSANLDDPSNFLKSQDIELKNNITPLRVSKELAKFINKNIGSEEYATFARQAAIDVVSEWSKDSNIQQMKLFDDNSDPFNNWRKASNGAGFCEISRLYFSKLTERYLKYFLEREASAKISNLHERLNFNEKLNNYVDDISKHAFETSKITQSYSAGWFNLHARDRMATDNEIYGFLSKSFAKMRAELLREEDK